MAAPPAWESSAYLPGIVANHPRIIRQRILRERSAQTALVDGPVLDRTDQLLQGPGQSAVLDDWTRPGVAGDSGYLRLPELMLDDPNEGTQARMSLGSTVKHLKDTDPQAADAIVALLAKRYNERRDPVEQASYIDGLGNTRYAAARPTIDAALHSDESLVRASAVSALRVMPGDDVDDAIARIAVSDPDSLVRAAGVSVIGEPTPRKALMQALRARGPRSRSALPQCRRSELCRRRQHRHLHGRRLRQCSSRLP
jgi:hypothetical protein